MDKYEVTVVETKQVESFDTMSDVVDFTNKVRKTFGVWDGRVTFEVVRVKRQKVVCCL